MVDLSKHPKIYEWDDTFGQMADITIINDVSVFALKIGESLYVEESGHTKACIKKHLEDMRLGIHVNAKINEAYRQVKSCQVYLLHSIGAFDHPVRLKEEYIRTLKADLNDKRYELVVHPELWNTDDDFYKRQNLIAEKLKLIEKEQHIPTTRLTQAAIEFFFWYFSYRDSGLLMNDGIAFVDQLFRPSIV